MNFQEPTEQVAGNMDIQTMMTIRTNFRNAGYRVTAKEFPKHYWTINAYGQPTQTQAGRVINAKAIRRIAA